MKSVPCAILLVLCIATSAFADEACPSDMNKAKADLMIKTKLVAVTSISVPADKYVSDEPDALEVVFLSNPSDGKSRLSPDGNVIFIAKGASDELQQTLTLQAFDIRLQRIFPAKCFPMN